MLHKDTYQTYIFLKTECGYQRVENLKQSQTHKLQWYKENDKKEEEEGEEGEEQEEEGEEEEKEERRKKEEVIRSKKK